MFFRLFFRSFSGRTFRLSSSLGFAFFFTLLAQNPCLAQTPTAPLSFINDVAPILRDNCFGCHGSKNPKGKLDLTKYETMRKGGTKDDPIVPGKPEDSYLIDAMKATDKSRMPPKDSGDPVPTAQIAIIEKWIAQGAKLDSAIQPKADLLKELRQRWSPPALLEKYKFPVPVTALAFDPAGKKLAASGQHEILVWNAETGNLEKRIRVRPRRIMAMEFLDENHLIAAGGRPGEEGNLGIYRINGVADKTENGLEQLDGVKPGKVLVRNLAESEDEFQTIALSADKKRLAAAGCDRTIQVWDLSPGIAGAKLDQTIENHADWIFGLAFTPDGKSILSASRDKTAKLWDLTAKESLATFPDHQNIVYSVLAMPDGKIGLSVGEDQQVRSWQLQGDNAGKQAAAKGGHGGPIFRMIWLKDQKQYVTASSDQTVKLWSREKGDQTKSLAGATEQVLSLAANGDGKKVAGGTFSGEILIWNPEDGKLVRKWQNRPVLPPKPVAAPMPTPAVKPAPAPVEKPKATAAPAEKPKTAPGTVEKPKTAPAPVEKPKPAPATAEKAKPKPDKPK